MELIDRKFSQKIVDKYTNLKLFTSNFAPITATKRIIPRMKWLELIYAMPYLVLKREILNSFRRTKNVFASAKQIWNIFLHLDYPRSRYEYITTRLDRFSREIMKIQDPRCKMQAKPVSSSYVNLIKSRGFYSKLPFMELAQYASHETTNMETEKELAVTNYGLPVVTPPLPTLSHKPLGVSNKNQVTYALHSTSDFINISSFNIINKKNEQKQLGIEKVPLYHSYPRIEHVTSTHTELIKEKVIEKEDKPLQATPQLPSFDLNRLTDKVYQLLERKIRIERERRGLLCR